MSTPANPVALADSILENAEPLIARDLVSLTLASEDPDDHRRFLELVHKRRQKEGPGGGATFHFTFDMGAGSISAQTVEVIDNPAEAQALPNADDLRPAIQAPEPPAEFELDLADLLGAGE